MLVQHRVPPWALVSAITAPSILVTSATLARLVTDSRYDPIGQTMSVLAGSGRSEWIMTAGFVLSALAQIVTAAGLFVLRPLSRVALAVAGCCALAVAALPVSVNTTATAHVLATGAGGIALALLPVFSMSAGARAPVLCSTKWAVAASAVMFALLVWVCYTALQGGALGLAERVTAVGELAWPLAEVVVARGSPPFVWRTGPGTPHNEDPRAQDRAEQGGPDSTRPVGRTERAG